MVFLMDHLPIYGERTFVGGFEDFVVWECLESKWEFMR